MGTSATEQSHGLRQQVDRWAEAARHGACVERLEDSGDFYACVPGATGAWGSGPTPEEAVEELESALVDWVLLKLELGADDIPDMGGIRLTP
ncbi:MAG: hypothetical protein OXD37_03645 [Acidimicrobiaceae bacterium]|nr:hypothetical protein [Acidimicrobiaceae bacterium]